MDILIFLCLLPFGAAAWIGLIGLGWCALSDLIRKRHDHSDNDDDLLGV